MDIRDREILELVRRTLTPEQTERSLVYWDKRVRPAGARIQLGPETFPMPFEGTIVFVDLAPRANWAHPCLYILVETRTLATKVLEASLPPNMDESPETLIILLRYGQKPPHDRCFNAFG